MKVWLSILMSFFILLGSFTNAVTYLTFKINQNEIAKTLCVLRSQKNNTCNGHCVLNAKLKEIAQKEKKEAALLLEKQETLYIVEQFTFSISMPCIISKNKIATLVIIQNPKAISLVQFRPPIS